MGAPPRVAWRPLNSARHHGMSSNDGLDMFASNAPTSCESHVFTPLNDPLRQLAFGSTSVAVESVLVGGDWKVRSGKVVTVGEAEVLSRARELGREIVGRFDEAFELGRQLLEPLRGGWLEALRTSVGVERKLTLE